MWLACGIGAVRSLFRADFAGFCLAVIAFLASLPAHGADAIPPEAARYRAALVREAHAMWGLNAPVAMLAAQVHQESRWRADAASPVGAGGLSQIMPTTEAWLATWAALRPAEPPPLPPHPSAASVDLGLRWSPRWALRALAAYDRWLWDRVAGADTCERAAKTLSGYNGGLSWIARDERLAASKGLDPARWFDAVAAVNAGRSPAAWRENRTYPLRILRTLEPVYIAAGWGTGACA